MIQNRLEKNWKKLDPWARQHRIEAYRIYDHDIPEFPLYIDKYREHFVIYDRTDTRDAGKNQLPQIVEALHNIFKTTDEQIIIKKRERQKGENQYSKLSETEKFLWIQESQARFRINLWDYLDTGLFLDHRPIRQTIFKESQGKQFLNLFCYTGSVSVFAALGGAKTTSVDMSRPYIEWSQENFKGNNIPLSDHEFVQENAIEYLDQSPRDKFDLIFLDPPTFSNSKRMSGTFEVERDQDFLVFSCIDRLTKNGKIYFSNNKQKFKLSDKIRSELLVKDITAQSIPRDFHNQKIHNCFEIKPSPCTSG